MLTMTDLFCGAGGSSTGALTIPGVTVSMAANHWALAIETHNANHPETRHDCADISQVDPRRYPATDILWASPECTNHSQARGKRREVDAQPDLFGEALPDEAAERSRATMWDVPRFAEHHRYRAVIVENVVDAAKWAPFKAWTMAMDSLGYDHQLVWLNSMHAQALGDPAPQSRDRMYVVFHQRGERRPDIARWTRPKAWCPGCQSTVSAMQSFKRHDTPAWGRYRAQYMYRCPQVACRNRIVEPAWLPAAAAIDWSLPAERIGDRVKPLAPKTMARIMAGLQKYGNRDPFLIRHYTPRGQLAQMCTSVAEASPTYTASFVPSLLVPVEGREGKQASPAHLPMRTMTARNETGLVIPLRANNVVKRTTDPFDTFAAAGNHHALLQHLVVDYNGPARTTGDPFPTVTTVQGDALASIEVDVADCLFRMFEPHEVAAGMAFPADYLMLGNKRERVRLAGNAVTPPVARDLIAAVSEALTGEAAA